MKWIPTKYKYPKKDMRVLVTKDVFGVPMVALAAFTDNLHKLDPYDFADKKYNRPGFFNYDSEWGYYEVTNVTAWMPIPEPWEDK